MKEELSDIKDSFGDKSMFLLTKATRRRRSTT